MIYITSSVCTGGVKPAITMNASHFAIGTYSSPVLGDKTIFKSNHLRLYLYQMDLKD